MQISIRNTNLLKIFDELSNTSAATIPLALWEAAEDGRIRPGHRVVLEAMGGGLTWGSAMVVW